MCEAYLILTSESILGSQVWQRCHETRRAPELRSKPEPGTPNRPKTTTQYTRDCSDNRQYRSHALLIGQERARIVMGPQLPSLVVPQIVIRIKLLDTHHTLCSYSFLGSYKHPDGMGLAPFLRALVALSASQSTRSQGADTVISLAGCLLSEI
jgi:hypothetical protein